MTKFKPDIKTLLTIHTAFLYGQVLFAVVAFLITDKNQPKVDENFSRIIQTVAALFTVTSVAIAFFLFKKKMEALQMQMDLTAQQKIIQYKTFSIVKFALLEAPCLFAIVAYFLTTNIYFMVLAAILIIVFAAQRPTVQLIIHHLSVSREDLME